MGNYLTENWFSLLPHLLFMIYPHLIPFRDALRHAFTGSRAFTFFDLYLCFTNRIAAFAALNCDGFQLSKCSCQFVAQEHSGSPVFNLFSRFVHFKWVIWRSGSAGVAPKVQFWWWHALKLCLEGIKVDVVLKVSLMTPPLLSIPPYWQIRHGPERTLHPQGLFRRRGWRYVRDWELGPQGCHRCRSSSSHLRPSNRWFLHLRYLLPQRMLMPCTRGILPPFMAR